MSDDEVEIVDAPWEDAVKCEVSYKVAYELAFSVIYESQLVSRGQMP